MGDVYRILIIDDDEDDFVWIRDILEDIDQEKYALDWEPEFMGALTKMRENVHDVYLVDYRLSQGTGIELLKMAKESGCNGPMIFLTGQGDTNVDLEAMEAGAVDYLSKGKANSVELERAIRYAVQRSKINEVISKAERLKTTQQLAGAVCHEFAQPLQILSLSVSLLKDQPTEQSHIDTSLSMINRISELVHRLRSITDVKNQAYLDQEIIDLAASSESK